MKKLISAMAAIAITVGAYAQPDSITIKMNPRELNTRQIRNMQNNPFDRLHADGVMMLDGKVLKVENGLITTLDHEMTMSNGTTVTSDGNYTIKNGTKTMLQEGQHMDMAGNMTIIKTNRDFNQNSKNSPVHKEVLDGVMMYNGLILLVKDGQTTILDREMTMSNGTKIAIDGNYVKEDGSSAMIEEGQHLDMSGNLTYVKNNKDKNMYLVPNNNRNK
ncbi:MAG: DUF6799 domain-containing protein [Bacteroidales bacterium]